MLTWCCSQVVEAIPTLPEIPLPAIQPNYRPLPSIDVTPLSPQRRKGKSLSYLWNFIVAPLKHDDTQHVTVTLKLQTSEALRLLVVRLDIFLPHSLLHFQFLSVMMRRMPASRGSDSTLRWWSTPDPRPLTCPRWWLCTSSASACCRTTSTVSGAAEATTIDTEFPLDGSRAPVETIN